MPKIKHEFIKIEQRLLTQDYRFFMLNTFERLAYIYLISMAKATKNKIPNNPEIIKEYMRANKPVIEVEKAKTDIQKLVIDFQKQGDFSELTLNRLLNDIELTLKRQAIDIELTLKRLREVFPKLLANKHFLYFAEYSDRHDLKGLLNDAKNGEELELEKELELEEEKELEQEPKGSASLKDSIKDKETGEYFPKPTEKEKVELAELKVSLDFNKIRFNPFVFMQRIRNQKGYFPPVDKIIKICEGILRNRPGNAWAYATQVLKIELPNSFGDLQEKIGNQYKNESERLGVCKLGNIFK